MQFPENYFEREIRDGFEIEPMMKAVWAASIEILNQIDILCRKYDIEYFADWGTLLGAVRHKGFIPWDDDIDIAMTRDNYNKFRKVALAELPDPLKLLDLHTKEDWIELLPRVMNTEAIRLDKPFLDVFHGCPYAIGVDIFVWDYVPRNEDDWKLQNSLMEIVYGASCQWLVDEKDLTADLIIDRNNYLKQIEELCNVQINREKNIGKQLRILLEQLCQIYTREESDEIAEMIYTIQNPGNTYKLKELGQVKRVPFDIFEMQLYEGYDYMLRRLYGENYMTPIPITKWNGEIGRGHAYPFYVDQEKKLREFLENHHEEGYNLRYL